MMNMRERLRRKPLSGGDAAEAHADLRARKPRRNLKRLEDSDLVALAKRGDKDAFGVLYERYVEKIYNYVYYRTGNAHDAEDLTARVFFRAMSHIGDYTERGVPFQAWLYRIAHNLVANWHRDRNRRKIIPLDDYIASSLKSDAPDRHAEEEEERQALLAAIRRLPEDRQLLLTLKFVDHLSNAEIGSILNRTEGAVKSLYHRTLLGLRDELRQHAPFPIDNDDLTTMTESDR
jgi:RNA polymerase sigma-70 factor (ECF subfamily)